MPDLDIIIPVHNEKENIVVVLESLRRSVRTGFRVFICYDDEDDTTLPVVRGYKGGIEIVAVKNDGRGPHSAVLTGFRVSRAPAVLVFPGDDSYNAGIVDSMYEKFVQGCDIVAASRFMKGGSMKGCPWLKAALVRGASFTLYWFAGLPVHDASNGLRLFSRKIIDEIVIESTEGFSFSIEILVKCHRLKRRICELPALWLERVKGRSRFRVMQWVPHYLIWYLYAFATAYLHRGPETVMLKSGQPGGRIK